jgi:hypothetical protein
MLLCYHTVTYTLCALNYPPMYCFKKMAGRKKKTKSNAPLYRCNNQCTVYSMLSVDSIKYLYCIRISYFHRHPHFAQKRKCETQRIYGRVNCWNILHVCWHWILRKLNVCSRNASFDPRHMNLLVCSYKYFTWVS